MPWQRAAMAASLACLTGAMLSTGQASAQAAGAAATAGPTVQLAQGKVRAALSADGKVEMLKGIPYAAPPVGALRWQPPQPAQRWAGIHNSIVPAACMQAGPRPWLPVESEDCLYVSVWRPAGTKPGTKLPVMVWIHGGGYSGGSSITPWYDGTHIAEAGVIQVSLNYRLGRLGYFAHPALTAEAPGGALANYGLMDQIAALKWVQANAAALGGDPTNVTVFGHSAGAGSVNLLMTAPGARGLFAKAIAMAGPPRDTLVPIRGDAARTGEKVGSAFAQKLGIAGSGADAARELRALPAARVADTAGGASSGPTGPMVDGVVLRETPWAAFAAGHEAKVPYIAGGNSAEGSSASLAQADPEVYLARTGALRDRIVAAYGGDPKIAAVKHAGDVSVHQPNRAVARMHARNGQKVWLYYFDFLPPSQRGTRPGVEHGDELGYFFSTVRDPAGSTLYGRMPAATAADLAMAKAATAYWVAFARNSDPGSAGGVAWPRFEPSTEVVFDFGEQGLAATPHFHQERLDLAGQAPAPVAAPAPQ